MCPSKHFMCVSECGIRAALAFEGGLNGNERSRAQSEGDMRVEAEHAILVWPGYSTVASVIVQRGAACVCGLNHQDLSYYSCTDPTIRPDEVVVTPVMRVPWCVNVNRNETSNKATTENPDACTVNRLSVRLFKTRTIRLS